MEESHIPEALWQRERQQYPVSEPPPTADVVVAGGGLVGVAIARALAEAGRRPVVLERARVASGASGRNGGLLLPGTAELYLDLVARWGRDPARDLWRCSVDGAAALRAWLASPVAACDWRAEGGLHVAASEAEATTLTRNVTALVNDGFDVAWLDRATLALHTDLALPGDFQGAMLLPDGGPLHSGRLVTGLAAAAAAAGARFVESCAMTGVTVGPEGVVVGTERGPVSADAVVVATNAWTAAVLPALGDVITPVRGQVQATAPLPERVLRGAWYVNDGFEYFQQLPDRRLVLGGMRWAAEDREVGYDRPDVNDALQARLSAWFSGLFPALGPLAVTDQWAGIMAFTPDRLPLIGPLDDARRLWVAAAFNGHGLPFAPLAAEIVTAGLTGRGPVDGATYFAPDRATLQRGRPGAPGGSRPV